ncbi:MAG: S8/S53 family peptidase [candidate division Zixibacteria bacterium]|nr:S8/S53 family peptidase [candidate division Zixibacteria bacterium]
MKRPFLFVFLLLLILATSSWAVDESKTPLDEQMDEVQYVPNQFVVQFKTEAEPVRPMLLKGIVTTGVQALDALNQRFEVTAIEREFPGAKPEPGAPDLSRYHIVTFSQQYRLEDAMSAYAALPNVQSVEPIGIHPLYDIYPNDPYFQGQADPWNQWGLHNASDHDIDAPCAWQINPGSTSVIMAILDSGVRYYHKDLGGASWPSTTGNIWINPGEIAGNGVDDDGNGYKDDWIGWDWVTGVTGCKKGEDCKTTDNDPRDFAGHGTHVAGIAGAMTNNARGVAGTAGGWGDGTTGSIGNGAKIMCLRIGWLSASGSGYVRMDFAAQAFYYAANKGATSANCSWGSSNSGGLGAAVDYAIAHGVLICHAAGNSNNNVADYLGARTDVMNVAATDKNDVKASFSSYGTWVDVSAPGVDIVSTYHNYQDPANDYVAAMSGTSMATPFVTGEAALVKSKYPSYTWSDIYNQIKNTTDNIDALNPGYVGQLGTGRINACRALGGTPSPKAIASGPLPEKFALFQNFPNPFNLATNISFYLSEKSEVNLTIYNVLGEKVRTLINGILDAGSHSITWDGKNETGSVVASGIYFYRLNAGDQVMTKKMSLLK